jgi:hypothetical protein
MNIIEQRIRMNIRKQLMLEAEGDNLSGYDIKIPSSKLIGDLKRWRVEHVNKQAKENKCLRGFLIVAKKVREPGDDSLLMGDITRTIAENPTFAKYFSNDYRIVISSPIQRGKRKIYAAWIIDMHTDKPTDFRVVLNKLQAIQSKSVYQEYQQFEKYTIGTTDIIDQSRAIAWTDAIRNYLLYLKTEKKPLYLKYFPDPDNNDKTKKQLRSIPDFSGMNRNIVQATAATSDTKYTTPTQINIDRAWKDANNFEESTFKGIGIVSTDPVTGLTTLTPVNGQIQINAYFINDPINGRLGEFKGDFIDGAPSDGTFNVGFQSYGGFSGDGFMRGLDQMTQFIGKLKSTTLIISKENVTPISNVTLEFISGKLYYVVSIPIEKGKEEDGPTYDDFGSYFYGTFKGSIPDSGIYYTRPSESEEYVSVGRVVNGKYLELAKQVKYPYIDPSNKKTLYQPKDNPDYVYVWFADKNAWGQVLTEKHTKLVNNLITPAVFEKYITYITDPATVTKLSTEFNEGPNYVILKSATPIQVQNDNSDKFSYDPAVDKRGTKLEWTGAKIKRYADNIDWYPTLMTAGGKYLPDRYWISSTDVATEMLNYPFK